MLRIWTWRLFLCHGGAEDERKSLTDGAKLAGWSETQIDLKQSWEEKHSIDTGQAR